MIQYQKFHFQLFQMTQCLILLLHHGEGEELDIESSERVENETSDIESLILDSSSSSEITKANDEEVETGSLEEFIEDQF